MTEAMDNFRVHVIACSRQALLQAVKLGCMSHSSIEAWNEVKEPDGSVWFTLYWHLPLNETGFKDLFHKFPTKLNGETIAPIVEAWLAEHSPTDPEPDLDGSVSRGFELKANFGSGWSYEIFRVRVIWAEHHK